MARDTCHSFDCVNPDHCKSGTRADHGRWITASGRYASSLARMAAPYKARLVRKRRKLDIEKARAIRASTDCNAVLAERYGVAKSVISSIRRGQLWKELGPFAALLHPAPTAQR